MFHRLYVMYLLFRVINQNPAAHRPAMEKLIKMGGRVVKRVRNAAMNNEVHPYRIAATFSRKTSLVSRLPSDEAQEKLKQFLEELAQAINTSEARRKSFGEILVSIGVEAWNVMMDSAENYPDGGYTMAAYHIMPQFVHNISLEHFVDVALNHSNEAIRSQAIICVQQYDAPQEILDKISAKYGGLLQHEERFRDLLYTTAVNVRKFGNIGIDTVMDCWHSENDYLKKIAIRAMEFQTDSVLFERFLEAIQSTDTDICKGGLRGVAISDKLAENRPEIAQLLLSRFDKDATSDIKSEIIRMLGIPYMIQNSEILLPEEAIIAILDKLLAIVLSDADAIVIRSAIRTLGYYGASYKRDVESLVPEAMYTKIIDRFVSIKDTYPESSVRNESILALGQCGEALAVEPLKSLLKELEGKADEYSCYLAAEVSDLLEEFLSDEGE